VKCCEPRSSGRKREQERKEKEEKIRQKPRREKLKVERENTWTPYHHCHTTVLVNTTIPPLNQPQNETNPSFQWGFSIFFFT
jgi:hypothetical protein